MTNWQLKEHRKLLALTQVGLAKMIGVTSTTLARWERGEQALPAWMDWVIKGVGRNAAIRRMRRLRDRKTREPEIIIGGWLVYISGLITRPASTCLLIRAGKS